MKIKPNNLIPIVSAFIMLYGVLLSESSPIHDANVEVDLVSEVESVNPQEPFLVALQLKMDPRWHTYLQNPGDSGLSPTIKWNLPDGFSAGNIQWPFPQIINVPPLTSYGYEGMIYLLTQITPPSSIKEGENVVLKAKVNWLACETICIPGKGDFELTLPVLNSTPQVDEKLVEAFANTRLNFPLTSSTWNVSVHRSNQNIIFQILSTDPKDSLAGVYFYPKRADLIEHNAPQVLSKTYFGYELSVPLSSIAPKDIKIIEGILVSSRSWVSDSLRRSLEVKEDLSSSTGVPDPVGQAHLPLILVLLFAFIGGLILNLMPCVLPVLSLKILSLVKHSKGAANSIWRHGVAFSCGVLVSFLALSLILIGLKAAGEQIGWGFQFQSSGFIIFLSAVFFMFALNLFGVFEINLFINSKRREPGLISSFLSGVLATITATPCSAPFMGTALGVALSQPLFVNLLIFTFLGIGMSFPYLLLTFFPQFLRFLPKPGPWMDHFKRFLGLLLVATVSWLLWILGLQKGVMAIISVLVGLLFLGLGAWIFGMLDKPVKEFHQRLTGRIVLSLFMVFGLIIAYAGSSNSSRTPINQSEGQDRSGLEWLAYSPKLLADLKSNHRLIFLDFTAAWCLTCQVNERVAFTNADVIKKFKAMDVVLVKVDWTSQDPEITRLLAEFGKNSIPLYVLIPKDPNQAPLILPEVITPKIVLDFLSKIE